MRDHSGLEILRVEILFSDRADQDHAVTRTRKGHVVLLNDGATWVYLPFDYYGTGGGRSFAYAPKAIFGASVRDLADRLDLDMRIRRTAELTRATWQRRAFGGVPPRPL